MTAPDLARRLVEHPSWTWQPGMGVLYCWGVNGRSVFAGHMYSESPIPFGDGVPEPVTFLSLAPLPGTKTRIRTRRCDR